MKDNNLFGRIRNAFGRNKSEEQQENVIDKEKRNELEQAKDKLKEMQQSNQEFEEQMKVKEINYWLESEVTQPIIDGIRKDFEESLDHLLTFGIPDVSNPAQYVVREEFTVAKEALSNAITYPTSEVAERLDMLQDLFEVEIDDDTYAFYSDLVLNRWKLIPSSLVFEDSYFDVYAYIEEQYGWDIIAFFQEANKALHLLGEYVLERSTYPKQLDDFRRILGIEKSSEIFLDQLQQFDVFDEDFTFRPSLGTPPSIEDVGFDSDSVNGYLTTPHGLFSITALKVALPEEGELPEEYVVQINDQGVWSRKSVADDEWQIMGNLAEEYAVRHRETQRIMNNNLNPSDEGYASFEHIFVLPSKYRIINNETELAVVPLHSFVSTIREFGIQYEGEALKVVDQQVESHLLVENNEYTFINYEYECNALLLGLRPLNKSLRRLSDLFHQYESWSEPLF